MRKTNFDKGPVVVARRLPKERADVENGAWWFEYRVRKLADGEYDRLRETNVVSPFAPGRLFVLESRRIDTESGAVVTRDNGENWHEWRAWAFGDTPVEVIGEMVGDSGFRAAESLVPEHAVLVRHAADLRAAHDAEYEANKRYSAAAVAVDRFKTDADREYAKKTAGKSEADAKKVAERMLKRVNPALAELRAERDAADAILRAAEAARKAAEKRPAKLASYPDLMERFAAKAPKAVAAVA